MLFVPLHAAAHAPARTAARTGAHGTERFFDEAVARLFGDTGAGCAPTAATAPVSPALDVRETDTHYTVTLDLPGVQREDVKVAIDGRGVRVEAPAPAEPVLAEGERLVWRERRAAGFARRFALPQELDQTRSSARLDAGVLTLTLGKKAPPAASTLQVD